MAEDKKAYILGQVGQLYMRHGIRSVTMDDVAAEVGVSKKTLYQFFKDKADLVDQVVTDIFMRDEVFISEEREKLNAIDRFFWIREHIIKMLKMVHNNLEYDLKKGYPKVYRKIIDYKRKWIYTDNLDMIEHGKRDGFFREELDSDFVARLAVGRLLFVFNPDNEVFSNEEVRDIRLFDLMMDYHMHAICTETGLKYYKQQLNNVQNEN